MKNFLTFALKLGFIFIKLALLMAACLGKAIFALTIGLLRASARNDAREAKNGVYRDGHLVSSESGIQLD